MTLKTLLIAATAAAALLGAAVIAVPTAEEGTLLCLDVGRCLSF